MNSPAPPSQEAARKAGQVDLADLPPASEAFVRIAQECMGHWQANEAALLTSRAAPQLHQMRVGIRRLRSSFSLFRPMLIHVPGALDLAGRLRAAALVFGPARDLDVLLAGPLAEDLTATQVDQLREAREAAYDSALTTLNSPAWAALRDELTTFRDAAPWGLASDPPIDVLAARVLGKRRHRVVQRGAHLRRRSPAARHAVRIEAKKLRYGSEFFSSAYAASVPVLVTGSGERLVGGAAYARVSAELTDALGLLNDHAIAAHLLTSVGALAPGLDEAALLTQAVAAQHRLCDLKTFWT